MKKTIIPGIRAAAFLAAACAASCATKPATPPPFEPTMESLEANFMSYLSLGSVVMFCLVFRCFQ